MRLTIAFALALCTAGFADVITLKSGRVINGTYLGGDAHQVKVAEGDQVETLPVTDIARIEFGNGGGASAPNPDRPVLRRAGQADAPPPPPNYNDGRPTLRRADSQDAGSSGSSSSGSYGDNRPTLRRADNSDGDYTPPSSGPRAPAPILMPDAGGPSVGSRPAAAPAPAPITAPTPPPASAPMAAPPPDPPPMMARFRFL